MLRMLERRSLNHLLMALKHVSSMKPHQKAKKSSLSGGQV